MGLDAKYNFSTHNYEVIFLCLIIAYFQKKVLQRKSKEKKNHKI